MRKGFLLSMMMLAGTAVGSAAVTAQAAEAGSVQVLTGDCYKVVVGQGICTLQEVLEELGIIIDAPGADYPGIELPDTEMPDTEAPDAEVPEESVPDPEELSYAEQVVRLVNKERAKAGLPALEMQADLTAAANVRAREIKQSFSHTRPDGSSFSSVLKEHGVSYRGSGENIAYGQKTPEQVMEGWMNSDGHRANILNKNYKNIGVGYYQDERGVNHWVQLFTY